MRLPKQHQQRALLQQIEHRIACYNNNYTKLFCGRKQKVFCFDTFIVRPMLLWNGDTIVRVQAKSLVGTLK